MRVEKIQNEKNPQTNEPTDKQKTKTRESKTHYE